MKFLEAENRVSRRARGLLLIALSVLAGPGVASAQNLTTLASFSGIPGGVNPVGSLIADASGDLFGTTVYGGTGYGTVFEIAKTSSGYASTPITLVSFDNNSNGDGSGAYPLAGLIADTNGNLFGTTEQGGTSNAGTVFEIIKTSSGYATIPTSLVSFNGSDGANPEGALMADPNGNLFGTTVNGGAGYGTVFEIVKTSSGYASTPVTVVSFNGGDGANPQGALIADTNGNLFGTTETGPGPSGLGTVFEIAKTASGYASAPTILVSFNDGAYPLAGLVTDANGDLFGTTRSGGAGYGTVFEIVNTGGVYAGTATTLVSFDNSDGAFPLASLIVDANSNLFGTTYYGGASSENGSLGVGTVFEIVNAGGVYASTATTLANFDNDSGGDGSGAYPQGGLIADANGNLFGTTQNGGTLYDGTLFEITGSGFVPPRQFAGTPGSADCIGKSTSTLAHTYGGIAHAVPALGYTSVNALQNAVAAYCAQ